MQKRTLFFLSLLVIPALAFGLEETLQAESELPYWTIASQMANLSLLIAIIYFSQRKAIAQVFKDKRDEFLSSVKAASQSKQDAEDKLAEVTKRLDEMNKSFSTQIEEAKKNAEESYRVQLADAKNSAEKIKGMAQASLEYEVQKQIENLRIETFHKSADVAQKELEKKLTPEQLKMWNSRFSTAQGAH